MPRTRRDLFSTIRSEGALLPSDLLQRIAEGDRNVPGLTPEAYHLAGNEKLNEAVSRSWNRLLGVWGAFQAASKDLKEGDPATGFTRDKWLLPLFQELGYGRLQAAKAFDIAGKAYPISHCWQQTPIHLLGRNVDLDHRSPRVAGAARISPHGLLQEFLNRSEERLWGFLSNGLKLRILRESKSLTRRAHVEFDLAGMMDGQVYADFAVLWLLCHQSRVEAEWPTGCWLEKWAEAARQEGTRALDTLRDGVQDAIEALGRGFLAHPANTVLIEKLRSGSLGTQDYYRQLLRAVYRMIFLFVAEDRDLLLTAPPGSRERQRYARYYSMDRLRSLAERRRGTPHTDLWQGLLLVFHKLGMNTGCPELGIPPLGSYLWSAEATPNLDTCQLANGDLLAAVRSLGYMVDGGTRRPIDYKNLGPEELGSVYESLLELHSDVNADAHTFDLKVAAGHERKTSGSYYTPDSLVQCLLDSALEPVVDERLEEARRMASGEWRMVQEPYRKEFANYARQRLSRSGSLATRASDRQVGLYADEAISEGGALRHDVADPPGGDLDPGQYRRGLGQALSSGVHPVSANSEWQPDRAGDASDSECGRGALPGISHPALAAGDQSTGQTIAHPGAQSPAESEIELLWRQTPLATRYSLFAPTAILALKICDPAVGSGHFLIAAAHRLARRVASARSGEDEPSPEATRTALRDVIGRCLYGVDVNPMAAELCRVSLWLEALEPGKPLSFLDHHIRVGNSLLGATPELIAAGLPDEVFTPIEGDDKKVCSTLKKRNRQEREGQRDMVHLMVKEPDVEYNTFASRTRSIDESPDDTIDEVRRKADQFHRLVVSPDYRHAQQVADAWCAAFVWRKHANGPLEPITTDTIRRLQVKPNALTPAQHREVERLSWEYQFFHWHLAFPEVFGKGGFDCVFGNPPWERVKIQEKEWFAERSHEIAKTPNAAARKRMIDALEASDPALYRQFIDDSRKAQGESHLMGNSCRYPLCGRGDINLYAVFSEGMRNLLNERGRVGCVLPSGIATDDTTKFFFQDVVGSKSLASLFDFENKGIFPGVHSSYKFCLFTSGRGLRPTTAEAEFVFFAHAVKDLRDPERRFTLSAEDIALLNPYTRTCPIFRSRLDAELTKALYRRIPVLGEVDAGCDSHWHLSIPQGLFHQTNDAPLLHDAERLEAEGFVRGFDGNWSNGSEQLVTMYEGRMIHLFNHRASSVGISNTNTFRSGVAVEVTQVDLADPSFVATPRYWVSRRETEARIPEGYSTDWFPCFKDVTSATNERTMIAAVIPRTAVVYSLRVVFAFGYEQSETALLLGCFNSFCFDYVARGKTAGNHITDYIIRQLPVLPPASYVQACSWSHEFSSTREWLLPRLLELTYTAWDLEPFAQDYGWSGPPFRWDEERRFLLRCELDAAFFHLYLPASTDDQWKPARIAEGAVRDETDAELAELKRHFPTPRDAVSYIMDTFPIVRRKDEEKWGECRTKRVILEIYDSMAEAIRTGQPYQTCLDPPPADPRCCHPPKEVQAP